MGAKRIFLVDDDVMLCELLKDHLTQKIRHDIHVFNTGEEALKQLHLEPQVVILDYELNTVIADAEDGLHILQKIKDFDKKICVIMLSSQTHYGKAAQTIVKGALEYVVKDNKAFNHIDKILAGL
ncbi:MAG: response regulator [Vicingaceae bacterium]